MTIDQEQLEEPGTSVTLLEFTPSKVTHYIDGSLNRVRSVMYQGIDTKTGRHYIFTKHRAHHSDLKKAFTVVGDVEEHLVMNGVTYTRLTRAYF